MAVFNHLLCSQWNAMLPSLPPHSVLLPSPCFAGLGVEAGGSGNRQGPFLQTGGYLLAAIGTLG